MGSTDNPGVPINSVRVKLELGGDRLREMQTPGKGLGQYALGIAKVIRVDYEAFEVTLMVMLGEDDYFQRVPVPLSFPGAGPRSFLGAMPERGSYCVIGYLPAQPHKIPVVLTWVVPGVALGHDWIPTQEFEPTEFDFNARRQAELEGLYERVRHKLRHMRPGNIVASSSQGSDLVLDESVWLANRRSNEIRIRDQDQAIVTRSVQRFDVQGGVRVYSGTVQRDASLLPVQMFSDGRDWASFRQKVGNVILAPDSLSENTRADDGVLTPHDVFFRDEGAGIPQSQITFKEDLDPYEFLIRGLFINRQGGVEDSELTLGGATYGGKRYFRTLFDPTADPGRRFINAATGANERLSDAVTEYRVEVQHTWDQTLPVSEQTDGFDADRLPAEALDETNELAQGERPFVQVVYGTVVGNDPYSLTGRDQYGVPLRPVIFDENGASAPNMETGLDTDVNTHAASLFMVEPPLAPDLLPTFFSVTKEGRVKASVGGPTGGNSIELAAAGSIRVVSGGRIFFEGTGGVCFNNRTGDSQANLSYEINGGTGAVRVTAGGPLTDGNLSSIAAPEDGGTQNSPHLILDAPATGGNAWLTANRDIMLGAGGTIYMSRASSIDVTPKNLYRLLTDKVSMQVKTVDKTVLAASNEVYSGPANFSPTNAPLRSVTFAGTPLTGHVGGDTDKYLMVFGDRTERFLIGNHETQVIVGDITYSSIIGTVTMRAGVNQLAVSTASGLSAQVPIGTMSMQAVAQASFKGLAQVQVSSVGQAVVSGSIVTLAANAIPPKIGGIVSGADIDPLSGLPLFVLGLGSSAHVLTSPLIP